MTPTIISFSGYVRSGKDTAADALVEKLGYEKLSFAAPLKEAVIALDPIVTHWQGTPVYLSEYIQEVGGLEKAKHHPEIRRTLQRFGTEVGRNIFGQDFWLEQLVAKMTKSKAPGFVIPDARFVNELALIDSLGGVSYYISRTGIEAPNDHSSESLSKDSFNEKYVIENNFETAEAFKEEVLRRVCGN